MWRMWRNVKNVKNVQNVNSCDWRRCIRMLLWASLGFSMTAPCCWRDALLKSPGCWAVRQRRSNVIKLQTISPLSPFHDRHWSSLIFHSCPRVLLVKIQFAGGGDWLRDRLRRPRSSSTWCRGGPTVPKHKLWLCDSEYCTSRMVWAPDVLGWCASVFGLSIATLHDQRKFSGRNFRVTDF